MIIDMGIFSMKDLAELKSELLASGTTEHKSANPCPRPTVSPLVTNPTSHIEEYEKIFFQLMKQQN